MKPSKNSVSPSSVSTKFVVPKPFSLWHLLSYLPALLTKKTQSGFTGNDQLTVTMSARIMSPQEMENIKPHLEEFKRVIQWPHAQILPPTWLQVQSFPDCLAMMAQPAFPLRPLGLVHIRNVILLKAPLDSAKPVTLETQATGFQPHKRGVSFEFVTTASQSGRQIYQARATNLAILHKKRTKHSHRQQDNSQPEDTEQWTQHWDFPSDTGRAYARVSADYNPIHLYHWSAKLLGFKSAIAHGMYCKARCLSQLPEEVFTAGTGKSDSHSSSEGHSESVTEITTNFFSPVYLPANPLFSVTSKASGETSFYLSTGEKTHLTGTVTKRSVNSSHE